MAADDKISGKRRKLFKALSAAPVVMTLRPGSALATQSAIQCLSKDTLSNTLPISAPVCGPDEDCFAYLVKPFWVVPSDAAACAAPLQGKTIVETSAGVFVTTEHDIVSARVQRVGDTLNILTADLQTVCVTGLEKQDGYFLVLAEPIFENGVKIDLDLANAMVFPEKPHTGTAQGITQTCLLSIPSTASGFTFVRG